MHRDAPFFWFYFVCVHVHACVCVCMHACVYLRIPPSPNNPVMTSVMCMLFQVMQYIQDGRGK